MSARPPAWRTGLLLLLMVAVLVGAGWYGLQELTSPLRPTTPPCDSTTVIGSLSSDQVTVRVFNGGSKRGLAASLQTQLKGKGFNAPTAANTAETVTVTTIRGATPDAPEVQLVAAFFPESTTEGDNRTDHSVDVLVGDDFGTFDDQAPTQIGVASAVICTQSGSMTATTYPTYTGGPPNTSTPTGTPTSTSTSTPTPKPSATK